MVTWSNGSPAKVALAKAFCFGSSSLIKLHFDEGHKADGIEVGEMKVADCRLLSWSPNIQGYWPLQCLEAPSAAGASGDPERTRPR